MRSLRLKILALAALLVVLTQAGTIGALLFTASHEVEQRIRTDLATSGDVLDRAMKLHSERLREAMGILAGDPQFMRASAAADRPALARALARSMAQSDTDLAVVLDAGGRVLAGTGSAQSLPDVLPGLLRIAAGQEAARGVLETGNAAYHVTTVALHEPGGQAVGWLVTGVALNDTRARRIAAFGGQDIAFVTGSGDSLRVVGSSLQDIDLAGIGGRLADIDDTTGATLEARIRGTDYIVAHKVLVPGYPDAQVLLFQSVEQAMAPYRLLRWSALGVGLFALLVALAGGAIVTRAITHPVRNLAAAAARIRGGDYSRPVEVAARDELGMLAGAFNTMQGGIAEREARITYQAQYDTLTGLPNRLLALERLEEAVTRAQAASTPVSLLVVELGSFADIAAALGHEIGDALLSQAAERLRASADARHTVARLEGDEFLIILDGLGLDAARELAEDLLRLLGVGLSVRDVNISLDAVVGIALYPEHGRDANQLLLRASVARNDARNAHEPVHVYQDGREERRVRQLAILGDLRRAVRHDELKLYLQPKVSLADGRVCGAEALVRWDHPSFGWLPPGEFIGIAEQFGNISLVTHWALTAAVRECRLWVEDGLDISVSVNLSGRDLLDQHLPVFILQLLRDHDLAPRYLTVEITEEALVRDFARATLVLECLRDLGVRVSIDDFGTKYSSLAQLKRLPVDELKIDRTFVMELPQDRDDAAIVRSTLDLAHSLSLEVVAEGVESPAALQWLAAHGCERAQGFHISRPMPAEAFGNWVRRYGSNAEHAGHIARAEAV
ncbi:putative signaling protein [Gammaproteobacteria bacterium]|nr:putative signaling protein [Gammaproteobacteria bacterium]